MKITQIEVKKFRNLQNISIDFATGLNAIAGQNGTSKTSILGLIGHIFTYDKSLKTLAGRNFVTEFSEIFRFAYPDYDNAGEHIWNTKFDTKKDVPAVSYDRKESGKKEGIRIRVGKSERGSGKIKFPVIYLGMGRLFPLALEDGITSNPSELTEKEKEEFIDLHNDILLIIDQNVRPESITTKNKSFYAPHTDQYNHLGNSAGQDNLGQIITALISFKRLRDTIGIEYQGGILLIDELDASLFPAAQMKLVEKLDRKSRELNLQIFYTTHSLEVLSETQKKINSKIIFLDKSTGKIQPKYDLNVEELKTDLLVLGPDALKSIQRKRFVYCEDEEAVDMLKCILPSTIQSNITIFPTGLGGGELKEIAKRKIPDFKKSLIVLDGDTTGGNIENVICLPGDHGPDRIIYDFLHKTPPEDFSKISSKYTKQFCFKDLLRLETTTQDKRSREKIKTWYKSQKKHWGRSGNKVWKLWSEENEDVIKKFIEDFSKRLLKS